MRNIPEMRIILAAIFVVLSVLGVACSSIAPAESLPLLLDTPVVWVTRLVPSQTPASTRTPTKDHFQTAVPSPTVAVPPTATPHPMSIESLRSLDYPGSDIVILEELDRGANYRRYYASYLSEGLTIYGLLTIPDGVMPSTGWPAIIFNHGYIPPDQYRTTERYIAYVDWLARSGYIVFRIDYRGHDRSEGIASGAYSSPGYTIDVLNALAALKRFPAVDKERIGMWGHSMGGFLTLRAMVISTDIRAGVIWAGVVGSYSDLLEKWSRPAPSTPIATLASGGRGWRSAWSSLYGQPDENPDFWNSISSNSYLQEISGPVQLHHGSSDKSVPVELSQILAEQVAQAGKTAELYIYQGDDHNISINFDDAMKRTIAFFDRYLKNPPEQ